LADVVFRLFALPDSQRDNSWAILALHTCPSSGDLEFRSLHFRRKLLLAGDQPEACGETEGNHMFCTQALNFFPNPAAKKTQA
jgi:hypothetical protein